MASLLRRIVGRLLGRKPPQNPTPPHNPNLGTGQPQNPKVTGNRGIAARDLSNPDLAEYRRRLQAYGQPGVEIPPDEVEAFLENEDKVFVSSSNVTWLRYLPSKQQLQVAFGGQKGRKLSVYAYDSVSKDEAREFMTAASKGGKVWEILRVRGSRTAHKKPYRRIV